MAPIKITNVKQFKKLEALLGIDIKAGLITKVAKLTGQNIKLEGSIESVQCPEGPQDTCYAVKKSSTQCDKNAKGREICFTQTETWTVDPNKGVTLTPEHECEGYACEGADIAGTSIYVHPEKAREFAKIFGECANGSSKYNDIRKLFGLPKCK